MDRYDYLDHSFIDQGYQVLCGIDEVGRGPLAGPVVACACQASVGLDIPGIYDSKKLTEKKRFEIYRSLITHPDVRFGVGFVDAATIDQMNILQASLNAMHKAYQALCIDCDLALIDGNHCPQLSTSMKPLIKGDQRSLLIASASIIAKVTRDHYLDELDRKYPGYGFAKHKGYGTKQHLQALDELGPIQGVHRFSFAPVARSSALKTS